MKLSIVLISTGICISFLAGCASTLNVTYNSDPPGAVLYQGQHRFGYTPYTLQYPVSEEDKKRGYKTLAGTSVTWASGATAEVNSLKADLNQFGFSQLFTFQRPNGVPGRETDVRFSLELDRTQAMQRQAAAQEKQAAAQEKQAAAQRRQAAAQEEQARAERYKTKSPTNCTSTTYGNTVKTSCY